MECSDDSDNENDDDNDDDDEDEVEDMDDDEDEIQVCRRKILSFLDYLLMTNSQTLAFYR